MSKNKQRGFLLFWALGLLVIVSTYFITVYFPEQAEKKHTADLTSYQHQLATLGNLVQSRYLVAQYSKLQAGQAVAGFADPLNPTMAELNAAHVLNNWPVTGLRGGAFKVSFALTPAGCTPPNCEVQGGVSGSSALTLPNGASDDAGASEIVENGGADFAASKSANPGTFNGTNGLWNRPNTANAPAMVLYRIGYGSSTWGAYCVKGANCSFRNVSTAGQLASNGQLTANGTTSMLAGVTEVGNAVVTGNETVSGSDSASGFNGDGSRVVNVQNAAHADQANNAKNATSAGYGTNAGYATNSAYATNAGYANSTGQVNCANVSGGRNVCAPRVTLSTTPYGGGSWSPMGAFVTSQGVAQHWPTYGSRFVCAITSSDFISLYVDDQSSNHNQRRSTLWYEAWFVTGSFGEVNNTSGSNSSLSQWYANNESPMAGKTCSVASNDGTLGNVILFQAYDCGQIGYNDDGSPADWFAYFATTLASNVPRSQVPSMSYSASGLGFNYSQYATNGIYPNLKSWALSRCGGGYYVSQISVVWVSSNPNVMDLEIPFPRNPAGADYYYSVH